MSKFPELDAYISKSRESGVSDEQLKKEMSDSGYSMGDIVSVFGLHIPGASNFTEKKIPTENYTKSNNNESVLDTTSTSAQIPSSVPSTSQNIEKSNPLENQVNIPQNNFPVTNKKSHLLTFIIIILLCSMGGATAFAYFNNISFFGTAPYNEANIMSGLLGKIKDIETAKYSFSGSLMGQKREEGVKPFNIKYGYDLATKEKYDRDKKRANLVNDIISYNYFSEDGYNFPTTLSGFKLDSSIKDPLTNKEYSYRATNDSRNYELIIEFETLEAITKAKSLKESLTKSGKGDAIKLNGQKVMFSSGSVYIFLENKPPESMYQSLKEFVSVLPPDLNIGLEVTAMSDITEESSDFQMNVNGEGDFGDLTYKVNIDLIKKMSNLYLRISNFPALGLFGVSPVKGEWVKISSSAGDVTSKDSFDFGLKEFSEKFEESKETRNLFLKNVIRIADDTKLIKIKNKPQKEKIDGQTLYRYDLGLSRESLVSFVEAVVEEMKKSDYSPDFDEQLIEAELLIKELNSEIFSEVLDYHNNNTTYVLWVDKDGFPAKFEYSLRLVPEDEDIKLKGRQFALTFGMQLSDINKPIIIEEPETTMTLDDLFNGEMDSISSAREKGREASAKGSISTIRAEAEILFDEVGGYGTKAFPLGFCAKKEGTLFGDKNVFKLITQAEEQSLSQATCVSEVGPRGDVDSYAISIPMVADPSYSFCVDWTGHASEILGKVKGTRCE